MQMRLNQLWFSLVLFTTLCFIPLQAERRSSQQRGQTAATNQPSAKKKLALVGGMLLDGYEVPPLHRAAILIEDNKIVHVGPAAEVKIPPDATVIDTSGRTMLPGMMDLHAHMMLLGAGDYDVWFPWFAKSDRQKVMAISAKQFIEAGITTAVDIAGPIEMLQVRDRINKGEIPGPRMLVSGPMITLRLGNYPPDLFQWQANTPDEAGALTEKLAQAGVDEIKVYPMTRDQYKRVVEVAHKHNLKVHAHVYEEVNVRDAFEAGVDVLQHAGSGGDAPPYSKELIRDIVNSGRPVVMTMAHRQWIWPATIEFPERLQDPQLKKDFAAVPGLWELVQESFKNWHTLRYFQGTERAMLFREQATKQFIASGAVLGMGTDSGTPMNFHADALWREIKAHVDMGMSAQRAISAATRVNARIIGRARDLGTIEPGKLADIIVVKGDPLFNVMALAEVEIVVKDGVVVKDGQGTRAMQTRSSSR